ncbi:MAG: adenylate/guanylate cyclase domain-containing protein [Spirulinaceae cyanobacterium]
MPMNRAITTLVTPPHVHYLVVDADFQVIAGSEPLPDTLTAPLGNDSPVDPSQTTPSKAHAPTDATALSSLPVASVFEYLPELYGCEEIIQTILDDPASDFNLRGITRHDPLTASDCYFDLYLQHYAPDPQNPYLLIFTEDVTDKLALEQVLVQTTNETTLLLNALQQSRNYTHQIVSSIADALIVTSPQHRIKRVNEATATLFGYSEAELLDQPLTRLFVHPETVLPTLEQFLADRQSEAQTLEVLCCTQNGTQITVALSCSLVHPPSNNPDEITAITSVPNLVYIGRDVTERQRTQQRLTAQYAIASILSESGSLDRAIQQILQAIGDSLGWEIGEFWAPKGNNDRRPATSELSNTTWLQAGQPCELPVPRLQRVDFWLGNPERFTTFADRSDRRQLNESVTFAGQVWSAGQPQWITALTTEPTFGEDSATVAAGLRSAFAFPIQSGSEMLGVMTFFRCQQQPPDQNLLQMMTATGNQLGQFIKRKEAELALQKQQATTERLLLNILPSPIVDRLKANSETIADSFEAVTVLFADLVGFTEIAARLSAIELVERLNVVFSTFDQLSDEHGLEKIKTIGDAYMVVGGLPNPQPDHAERIAEMALNMQGVIRELSPTHEEPFKIRIGIHTGPVVAGVIGRKKFIYDLWGDTVNTASRMESHGEPGQIQVTAATYEYLCDRYHLTPREKIEVKGKGYMQTYWLDGPR